MEQYKPLQGIKVVELSLMVASASCGRMMADWLANILVSGSQYGFTLPRQREDSSPFGAPFKCSDERWFMPPAPALTRWKSAVRLFNGLRKFSPPEPLKNGVSGLRKQDFAAKFSTATATS